MIKTTRVCDICGNKIDPADCTSLEIRNGGGRIHIIKDDTFPLRAIKIDICRSCLEKHGFEISQSTPTLKNGTTLKDKLLNVLKDLDVSFEE